MRTNHSTGPTVQETDDFDERHHYRRDDGGSGPGLDASGPATSGDTCWCVFSVTRRCSDYWTRLCGCGMGTALGARCWLDRRRLGIGIGKIWLMTNTPIERIDRALQELRDARNTIL